MFRVTQRSYILNLLENIANQGARLSKSQLQLATQKRINAPSDDPIGTSRAMRLRTQIDEMENLIDMVDRAQSFVSSVETSLSQANDQITSAKEIGIRAANSALSQSERTPMAEEVNQIIESMLDLARSQNNGRYVFGGTDTLQDPFEVTRDAQGNITSVQYVGSDDTPRMPLSTGQSVELSFTGQRAFIDTGAFDALISLRDNLLNTQGLDDASVFTSIQTSVDALGSASHQQLELSAVLGARYSRLDVLKSRTDTAIVDRHALLSQLEDTDVAEVLTTLSAEEVTYKALLSSAGRFSQMSLFDYI